MEGTVIFFNPVKCWGFIAAADGRRIFVHADDVRRKPEFGYRRFLIAGDRVSFDIVRALDGRTKADNVVILQSSIRSESSQAYVERGRIFPRTDSHATFPDVRRPDGDSLYAHSSSVRTQGLARISAGENLECTYEIREKLMDGKFQYCALRIDLYEKDAPTDESLFSEACADVKKIKQS